MSDELIMFLVGSASTVIIGGAGVLWAAGKGAGGIGQKVENLTAELAAIGHKIEKLTDSLDRRVDQLHSRINRVEENIGAIGARLAVVEERTDT